ncbi:MAG: uridine kinase [Actinomycetaceae bacterium]|nr:uridine kinase [Actinomycetaceae bacterium]MDY6082818.1 uridine kinase [Actinomycetaceae bacterium]
MGALVIGVAGGTGSGKTTLTNEISRHFPGQTSVIYHDNYYVPHDDIPISERAKLNYDSPDAFDNELMVEQLGQLIGGQPIDSPTYDYAHHTRAAQTIHIEPKPVIIVEGILIFAEPAICRLLDIKIFVDTDADVRILRRIKRDVIERGRTLQSVEEQYLNTVKPMHELYVEPSKRKADLIVPEGGRNLVALDMLIHRIAHQLEGGQGEI